MINYENWIYQELKNYELTNKTNPYFISSWDCDPKMVSYPKNIIANSFELDGMDFSYKFSEDLIWVKERLLAHWLPNGGTSLSEDNISLGNNATSSIYLGLLALINQKKHRFLIITPSYYSIIDTLLDFDKNVSFYHLSDTDAFEVDTEEIRRIVRAQYIEVIVFADPVYCAGIELKESVYKSIIEISIEYGVTLFVDRTLGGLSWNNGKTLWVNDAKLDLLYKCHDFIFVSSEPKAFFLNDLKFSVIISSKKNIALIEDLASQVSGGLNKFQINLFLSFYSTKGTQELDDCRITNVSKITSNFKLLKSALYDTRFDLYPTNSGYFTMIYVKDRKLVTVDPKHLTRKLLYQHNILPLLGNYFNFFKDNQLSLRVNLMKDFKRVIPNLLNGLNENV
jgi:bifunctional pyridoxal-dependent enzyme with beta-cystathionase and maltose regulon repressor activities